MNSAGRSFVLFTLWTLLSAVGPLTTTPCSALSPYQDNSVTLKDSKSDHQVALWVMPSTVQDFTMTVDMKVTNMTVTPQAPYTFDVRDSAKNLTAPRAVLQAQQAEPDEAWRYNFEYHYKIGARGGRPDPKVVYTLPYPTGRSIKINQGYFGTTSHYTGSQDEYALDFDLRDGDLICAAREGTVVAVRQDSNVGGMDKNLYEHAANYVVVRHADGTYASYLHIQYNGARVRVGQYVARGTVLGLTGGTGLASKPHLHFDVSVPIDGNKRQTFPIKFKTATGVQDLVQGMTYTAE